MVQQPGRAEPGGARRGLALGRLPLLALGIACLVAGIWAGLHRLGLEFARDATGVGPVHGPLMACGFFGALIGLERAVALGARWAYAGPALLGGGGVLVALGAGELARGACLVGGGVLLAVSIVQARRHVADFTLTLVAAVGSLVVGNALWLAGRAISELVLWWLGFLVLTIFAERRELGRVLEPGPVPRGLFALLVLLLLAAELGSLASGEWGRRGFGLVSVAMALWLARWDVARVTVRRSGLTRFVAVALLGGYAWLGLGGVLAFLGARHGAGPAWDAWVHAVALGFVFSMVFAHAPIVFPAVLGVAVPYRARFTVHLALLHVGLGVRLAGDLSGQSTLRSAGGLANAAAIALFFAQTLLAVLPGILGAGRSRGPTAAGSSAGPRP